MDAVTALVKYVFVDVAGFTRDRSVEAQSDIVMNMNRIVYETILAYSIPREKLIVLPNGDGLCIALINLLHPLDIHLLIAIGIIERLYTYNYEATDTRQRFLLRIGISENVDNLITDFNGQPNVAGAGISTAQFIMNQADGNQIIVSENVYATLRHREKYMNAFQQYKVTGKHGQFFNVYQFIQPEHVGLNTEIPTFAPKLPVELQLNKLVGFYFVHAIKNRELFLAKLHTGTFYTLEYGGVILLYFLACDSLERFDAPPYKIITNLTWSAGKASIEEQLNHYCANDLPIIREFSNEIVDKHLMKYANFFEFINFARWLLVTDKGQEKLKRDCPDIWEEFMQEKIFP